MVVDSQCQLLLILKLTLTVNDSRVNEWAQG